MILQRLFPRFFAADGAVGDLMNPRYWDTINGYGIQSTAGEAVDPQKATALSVYFDCLRVLSEDVGKLPLKVYRRLTRGKELAPEHEYYYLLHNEPNQEMSSMTFRETLISHALGWGNGYAEIIKAPNGRLDSLMLLHPNKVRIRRDRDLNIFYEVTSEFTNSKRTVVPRDMIHVHGVGDDGIQGFSIASMGCESLGAGLALQKFSAAFYKNGLSVSGTLEHPGAMSETALKHLRESTESQHGGAEKAHKFMILEEGTKYNRIGVPPDEAQFIETSSFKAEDICRWFRMPPHKVGHLARATFSNIEHQSIEYVTDTLQPWLNRVEQEINRKLFGKDSEYFSEHLVLGLLRGDSAARAAYFKERVYSGSMSPNEVREVENENPIDDGDIYMVQSNMIQLSAVPDEIPEPNPQQPPVEKNEPEELPASVPESVEPPDGNPPSQEAIALALFPVFLDAARRVVAKETAATKRAAAKHRGNWAAFRQWSNDFFDEQRSCVLEAFRAPQDVYMAFGGPARPIAGVSAIYAEGTQSEVERMFGNGGLDQWVEAEADRAEALARRMQQEIANG